MTINGSTFSPNTPPRRSISRPPCRNGRPRSRRAWPQPTTSHGCAASSIVGGGRGTLLAAVLAARTHLHGVVFDLPEGVADAAETLRAAGVADRCAIDSGDFFVAVPAGGDGYLLAIMLHDWDDDRSVEILLICLREMHADGKVLIVERMIFDDPEKSIPTLLSDLNMLVLTGGQERLARNTRACSPARTCG